MKSFLIIGMGSFGHHLCRAFASMKCEIMIVDKNSEALEDMLSYVVSAKVADCTKEEVVRSFDIPSFSACFVCIGSDFESSLEITDILKELGAKKVFSKADKDIQAKFLLKSGADSIIYPEKETAKNLAMQEISDNIFECITLANDYLICEIAPNKKWIGKTPVDISMRQKYGLTLLASKDGEKVSPVVGSHFVFRENEHIIVMGHADDIKKII